MGVIYKITNNVNGEIYVGKTMTTAPKRWREHKWGCNNGTNTYLYNAMRKYGFINFTMEVIDSALLQEELDAKEVEWIAKLGTTKSSVGYNCTTGGEGGRHTGSSRALLKGVIKRSPEVIAAQKARIISPETRALISKIQKKLAAQRTPEERSARASHAARALADKTRGVPRPYEVRMKISVAHTGKKRPPETIARMSASKRGVKQSPEGVARRAESNRKAWACPEKRKLHGLSIVGRKWSPEKRENMRMVAIEREAKKKAQRGVA